MLKNCFLICIDLITCNKKTLIKNKKTHPFEIFPSYQKFINHLCNLCRTSSYDYEILTFILETMKNMENPNLDDIAVDKVRKHPMITYITIYSFI